MFSKFFFKFLICFAAGCLIWFIPSPEGIPQAAIHLFAIFVFTILGIILQPLPMGAMALIGLTLAVVTKTLSFDDAFSGFCNQVVWLVVLAFFIAFGFIKTGLGERIAYLLIKALGKNSLGMGYGVVVTDFILAPAIPSVTARTGGVIYPMMISLAKAFESEPHHKPRKIGAFLIQIAFQSSLVTSAMFLTAMAGNPLIASLAKDVGITIDWTLWAMAASVPGLICLAIIPLVLYKIYPPELKETPEARQFAIKRLKEMGKMKQGERIMCFSFVLLLVLWIFGSKIQMHATIAALIGLVVLLFTKVLSWDDLLKEKGTWNTLIWFSILVMMATYLNKLGLTAWFSHWFVGHIQHLNWAVAFIAILVVYFYSHYFFASNVAHIGSMYTPFLLVSVSMGVPSVLAALSLGFFSSLFGGLTHYGCGPAVILFAPGYVKLKEWWKLGFVFSLIYVLVWVGIGGAWWRLLGLF